MSMQETLTQADRIRAAALYMIALSPQFGEGIAAAQDLLLKADWTQDGPVVRFADGAVFDGRQCSCWTETTACGHAIASSLLRIVERWGAIPIVQEV